MFRNYIKTALRNFKKNLAYTLINVFGMAVGLSGVITTWILFDYEDKHDAFHDNVENVYRVNAMRNIEGSNQKYGVVPTALGPSIKQEISGVKDFCRYGSYGNLLVEFEEKVFNENLIFVDAGFFDIYNFPLISGNPESFKDKGTAIITQDFARKYFGEEEPINKQLSIWHNDSIVAELIVGGIAENIPRNSSIQFDIITQYENVLDISGYEDLDWQSTYQSTLYLVLDKETDPKHIESQLSKYVEINNETRDDWMIESFYMTSFVDQKEESRDIHWLNTWPGLPHSALYGSMVMNLLILFIAVFNFVNTAIAYAEKRIKEIGIRKTFGGKKNQIIIQFMMENFIQCLVAMILALDFANIYVYLLNTYWPINLQMNFFSNGPLIIFIITLLIVVSIVAGAYPSFYVSKFQPSSILKGDFKLGGTNVFTRILLTFQISLSIMAIFSGVALSLNAKYQEDISWGYDKEMVVVVPMHSKGKFEQYKNTTLQNQKIISVGGTIHNVGYSYYTSTIWIDGEEHDAAILLTGNNYIKTVGLKIKEGRDFLFDSQNDMQESVIVNEKFIETFQFTDPLNQVIEINKIRYHVVGVIEDFFSDGLWDPVKPVVMRLVPDEETMILCARANKENTTEIYNFLEKEWKKLFPHKPFEGYYQDDSLAAAQQVNAGIRDNFVLLAVFALFLGIAGLYSMVSLNINKRIKEIGIRKVMGASAGSIIEKINRQFIIVLIMAGFIGGASGYFFMDAFLADVFSYYMPMGPSIYILSFGFILLVAGLTSGRKIYKAALVNPAKSLRYE